MKAKIKATGEVYRVLEVNYYYNKVTCGNDSSEMIFQLHEVELFEMSPVDWDNRLYEVAKELFVAAMQNSNASGLDVRCTIIPSVLSTSRDFIAQLKQCEQR